MDEPREGVIRKLPALLVNQIAAGEVVDRPASVVKELVENSLDAGAARVRVDLDGGGIELVRVTDDGRGIAPHDLLMAVEPHATSKVREAADLDKIATLGFRGEALASIASVSRLSIRSTHQAQPDGAQLDAEGDALSPIRPSPGARGTTVTVRNLFFNTPARRKFLRTPPTEQGRCVDAVRQIALAHPLVAFTVTCDARTVMDLPAESGPRDRAIAILGTELAEQLIEFSVDETGAGATGPVSLWGLAGLPAIARATASAQYVFLNGRVIRDRTIQHAIKEAYRGLIEPGRHPTAVVMIHMDPAAVDVNVHPAKTEVRFRDSSLVHSMVLRSIREALSRADLTPAVSGRWGGGGGGARNGFAPSGAILESPHSGSPAAADRDLVNFLRSGPAVQGRFASATDPARGPAGFSYTDAAAALRAAPDAPFNPTHSNPESLPPQGDSHAGPDPALPRVIAAPKVLQVHNSFLVTQDEYGVVIIDQHALHERAMFERLLARVTGRDATTATPPPSPASAPHAPPTTANPTDAGSGSAPPVQASDVPTQPPTESSQPTPSSPPGRLESQRLLTPVVVRAGRSSMDRLDQLRPLFDRLGIEAESLGPDAIGVHAFPTFLFDRGVDAGEFLAELLDRAGESDFAASSEEALHEVLDMMACKAAIKAGDALSEQELTDLLHVRERIERASNCPHGRPTSIRLTIRELERRFGRS